ncbi:MAG TPA: hypothetical protein PLU11_07575 [Chitinophagaceae bacterium]|nr:hypothetical protein [Chitinophagaceae bacterium]HPN59014.1 hypothetical protein [Chitinophagaceae bacterium]
MKKFLAIAAIALFAVACNNSTESKDATADSLAKVATADSLAKVAADSAAKAMDTAAKVPADTAAKKDSAK